MKKIVLLTTMLMVLMSAVSEASVKKGSRESIKEIAVQTKSYGASVGKHTGEFVQGGSANGLKRYVLCVDGLKLFQTIGPTFSPKNNGTSTPVVSTIQLYEEREGKVFPAKCK